VRTLVLVAQVLVLVWLVLVLVWLVLVLARAGPGPAMRIAPVATRAIKKSAVRRSEPGA
jgi:hypothetical protein